MSIATKLKLMAAHTYKGSSTSYLTFQLLRVKE